MTPSRLRSFLLPALLLAVGASVASADGAVSLLPGDSATGDLSPGETDRIRLPGVAGQRLSLGLRAGFEPRVRLLGPGGTELDTSDHDEDGRRGGDRTYALRSFPLASTGEHTLEITADDDDDATSGSYSLSTGSRPPRARRAAGSGTSGVDLVLALGDLPGGATVRLRARGGTLLGLEGPSGSLPLDGGRRRSAIVPATGPWSVRVLPSRTGTVRVTASLRIPGGGSTLEVLEPAPGGGGSDDLVGRTVLVRLRDGSDDAAFDERHGCDTGEGLDGTAYVEVAVPDGVDVEEFLDALGLDDDVVDAEPVLLSEGPEGNPSSVPFTASDAARADVRQQGAFGAAGVTQAWATASGDGVVVAVLDTGILSGHPDLAGRLLPGIDLVDGDADPEDAGNGIDDDGDGLVDEGVGHGTFVAGLVAEIAPGALVLPVRVLDSDARGSSLTVARGIVRAVQAGARIVNLSLGVRRTSAAIQDAVKYAGDRGVLVVASSGNGSLPDAVAFPASVSDVLTLAAVDDAGVRAPFANAGSKVDLVAPGVGILAAFRDAGYATWSGTSFAAPFASGGAALVLSRNPGMRARDAGRRLQDTAIPVDALNPSLAGRLGAGRVQLQEAVRPR